MFVATGKFFAFAIRLYSGMSVTDEKPMLKAFDNTIVDYDEVFSGDVPAIFWPRLTENLEVALAVWPSVRHAHPAYEVDVAVILLGEIAAAWLPPDDRLMAAEVEERHRQIPGHRVQRARWLAVRSR